MPLVRDQMEPSLVTLEPGTGVVDAAKRMIRQEKGPLPMVEGERPVAIVTDRAIVAHVVAEGRERGRVCPVLPRKGEARVGAARRPSPATCPSARLPNPRGYGRERNVGR